ncbi:MAG: PAS domain S-box protein [Candidatus Heimdallarchaeaceae archaeon]
MTPDSTNNTFSVPINNKKIENVPSTIIEFIQSNRSLFDSYQFPVMITDADRRILYINPIFKEVTGYSDTDLLNNFWNDLAPPESLGKLLKYHHIRKKFPDKAPSSYETSFPLKNGQEKEFLLTITPLFNNYLFFLTFTDVTQKKLAKIELSRSYEQYYTLVNTSPDGILQLDKNLNIIMANNVAKRFIKRFYEETEIIGKSVFYLIPNDQHKIIHNAVKHAIKEGYYRNLELSFSNKKTGTTSYFEINTSVVYDNEEPLFFIAIVRNISDRKQMEKKLHEYTTKLEQLVQEKASKLMEQERSAMLGRLAASISHNINNPLQYVIGNAELILKLLKDPNLEISLIQSLAQTLISGCYRIVEVSDKLRRASRKSDVSIFDIAIPIEVAISVTKGKWMKKCSQIKVRYLTDETIKIKGVESDIAHVFMNLIINAVQAIKDKGEIEIRISKLSSRKVFIEIQDNGSGIPPDIADKIGKETVTTKSPEVGTGLGLLWVYDTIHQHYGTIDFETKLGKGTTFRIALPIAN